MQCIFFQLSVVKLFDRFEIVTHFAFTIKNRGPSNFDSFVRFQPNITKIPNTIRSSLTYTTPQPMIPFSSFSDAMIGIFRFQPSDSLGRPSKRAPRKERTNQGITELCHHEAFVPPMCINVFIDNKMRTTNTKFLRLLFSPYLHEFETTTMGCPGFSMCSSSMPLIHSRLPILLRLRCIANGKN